MHNNIKWLIGGAAGFALLTGSVIATGVSAQTSSMPGGQGADFCPGPVMMTGGAQADAMQTFMASRIESGCRAANMVGPRGPGMMSGRGMLTVPPPATQAP